MLSGISSSRTTGMFRTVVGLLSIAIVGVFVLCFPEHRVKAAPTVTFEGYHDGQNCSSIFGWAWDSAQPNTPISVDILSDGMLIATVPADVFRQDLLDAGKGNGFHAFNVAPPASLVDGQPHSIRVRITNTNFNLVNTPRALTCVEFDGFLERSDCSVISGWAWNTTTPNDPIDVDFFIDSDSFASIRAPASQFRQDLANAGKGNGIHAFSFMTPSFLKDGQPHAIHAKFRGTTLELNTSPKTLNCNTGAPPAFQGYYDLQNCDFMFGWAWNANDPSMTVSVDIYVDNLLFATTAANKFRQDLADHGIGDGNHAFMFPTPASVKDGQTHTISIGFHGTANALTQSPMSINCPP